MSSIDLLRILALFLALPGALWVTRRAGLALFAGVMDDPRPPVPKPLEAVLPLTGRWLRCFFWGLTGIPMILAMFVSQVALGWMVACSLLYLLFRH